MTDRGIRGPRFHFSGQPEYAVKVPQRPPVGATEALQHQAEEGDYCRVKHAVRLRMRYGGDACIHLIFVVGS